MEKFGSGINIPDPQHWIKIMRIYIHDSFPSCKRPVFCLLKFFSAPVIRFVIFCAAYIFYNWDSTSKRRLVVHMTFWSYCIPAAILHPIWSTAIHFCTSLGHKTTACGAPTPMYVSFHLHLSFICVIKTCHRADYGTVKRPKFDILFGENIFFL
jgi:hypothetical protein